MNSGTGKVLCETRIRARVGELIQGNGSSGRTLVSGPLSPGMAAVTSLHSGPESQGAIAPRGRGPASARLPEAAPSSRFRERFGAKTLRALQGILLVNHRWTCDRLLSIPSSDWEDPSREYIEDFSVRYHISRESNIPVGKGFSSSSADVLGLLSLLDLHFSLGLGKNRLYAIAAAIEPTDPLLDSQTVLFDSGRGRVLQSLPGRDIALLYFDSDPEGSVDTLADAAQTDGAEPSREQENDQEAMDDSIVAGFLDAWMAGDLSRIFLYTTRSALASHGRRPRPGMERLHRFALDHGAGLFVAHTGTLLGLLFPAERVAEVRVQCEHFFRTAWDASLRVESMTGDETALRAGHRHVR